MLEWNSWHPYNAVHVLRMPGAPDAERLKSSIDQTLGVRGLMGLTLNRQRETYCYAGGPLGYEFRCFSIPGTNFASLTAELERQINTPFVLSASFSPFRFFVAAGEGCFFLGLAYLHAVADAASIVLLLKDILQNYAGKNSSAPQPGPAPNTNALFSHPAAFAWKLASLPSFVQAMRNSSRPPCRNANDRNIGFTLFALDPANLRRLVGTATSCKVTVNDLLLALLMKGCALLAPTRLRTGRRKNISVGCIVNTRRDLGIEGRTTFGLALGSFAVTHSAPERLTLADLSKEIGRQTSDVKRKKLYLATALELSLGRFMFQFFSTERRKKLYQKHYPLWGGLTNMNINSLWQQQDGAEPIGYLRAVSTGPVTPLVVSFTTAGQAALIGLSYRSTVFSRDEIERLKSWFQQTLAELEVGR